MNFLQLEYFCKIAEFGNMTRAAEELHVSQPGLSRTVKALEDELAVALFYRQSKQLALTREGEVLLTGARQILQTRNQMLENIRHGQHIQGNVSFATSLYAKRFETVQSFQSAYPNIKVDFESYIVTPERLEAGVVYLAPYPEDPALHSLLEAVPVMEEEFVLQVPEKYPLLPGTSVNLKDLSHETFLLDPTPAPASVFVRSLFEKAGFNPKISVSSRFSNKPALVQLGVGLAFTTTMHATASTPGTRLIHIREPYPFRTLYLMWAKDRTMSEAEICLIEYVKRAFGSE